MDVPPDLDLRMFVGATLNVITIGEFGIWFHFDGPDPYGPKVPSISVSGPWEVRDEGGAVIDQAMKHAERDYYRVHALLSREVIGTEVDSPRSMALRFDGGFELRVFGENEGYESFQIGNDIYI